MIIILKTGEQIRVSDVLIGDLTVCYLRSPFQSIYKYLNKCDIACIIGRG